MAEAWKAIRGEGKLELDEPVVFGAYLGCEQKIGKFTRAETAERLKNIFPLVGRDSVPDGNANNPNEDIPMIRYDMQDFFKQCVDRYKELATKAGMKDDLKHAPFPSIDEHQIPPEDFEDEGILNKEAAKVVMTCLYGGRLVRYDLLWPIGSIARHLSKWTKACDRRLQRLMSYINSTSDHSL